MPTKKVPLVILDQEWHDWSTIGSTEMRIVSDNSADVKSWLKYLDQTVEVFYGTGDVEVWMVHTVSAAEDGKLTILLRFVRC
jgi:hypothetical protein